MYLLKCISKKYRWTFFTIVFCILAPSFFSLWFVHYDIDKENIKSEIHFDLNQASYYENTNQFEEAIVNYNKILNKYDISYKKFPCEYAAIQSKIGDAYHGLAKLIDSETNLENAIHAYNESLKIYKIESYPIQYAMTYNNIGNVYHDLAEIQDTSQDKSDKNYKAIYAYQESLRIYAVESYPIQYAMTYNNIGNVYHDLAEIQDTSQDKSDKNYKAAYAYQEALRIYTNESYPIQYTEIQNNIERIYST